MSIFAKKEIVELNLQQTKTLLNFANLKNTDVFYDLGSGTGKVVLEAVKKTKVKKAIGIEITKKYYELSRERALKNLSKKQLRRIDFWYGDYSAHKEGFGYIYDISDGTVIYNSLSPTEGKIPFYDTMFDRKKVIMIKKDLPLVGYLPVSSSKKEPYSWFFMMETPLNKSRTKSKKKWAQSVLEEHDSTIDNVIECYKRLWKHTNEKKDVKKPLHELNKLIDLYLPEN